MTLGLIYKPPIGILISCAGEQVNSNNYGTKNGISPDSFLLDLQPRLLPTRGDLNTVVAIGAQQDEPLHRLQRLGQKPTFTLANQPDCASLLACGLGSL